MKDDETKRDDRMELITTTSIRNNGREEMRREETKLTAYLM